MIRVAAKLIILFALLYAGVHLGYARLEKELLQGSCCPPSPPNTSSPQKQGQTAEAQGKTGRSVRQQTGNRPASTAPSATADNKGEKKEGQPDFQSIIRRNIFQLVQEAAVQPAAPPVREEKREEVVPTRLNLTLVGTVTGTEQTARAIILESGMQQQKLFQVGDSVQRAIIESIERGKVTLDVNGTLEVLQMKKREGGGPRSPFSPGSISRPSRIPRRTLTPPPDDEIDADIDADIDDDFDDIDDVEMEDEKEGPAAQRQRSPAPRRFRRPNFRRNPARQSAADQDSGIEDEDAAIPPDDIVEELPPDD
ncbi:MAG: type II secretion system protein N [Candidatus Electrothrix sp. YB6]